MEGSPVLPGRALTSNRHHSPDSSTEIAIVANEGVPYWRELSGESAEGNRIGDRSITSAMTGTDQRVRPERSDSQRTTPYGTNRDELCSQCNDGV